MHKKALVTGGAGFIGSHLVERLVREGWRVRTVDNLATGDWANLSDVRGDLEMITGDIRDVAVCEKACRGVDAVFHMAAIASVTASISDPVRSHETNVAGTLNLLVAARDAGVSRFVFSSSASVYGNANVIPTSEDQPHDPQSPYASGKAAAEMYCRNFWQLYQLETVILRYFNVFGPRQSSATGYGAAIPIFIKAAMEGRAPTVFGDGGQTRDFVYVENVVQANLKAATARPGAGGAFNIAAGQGISLLHVLEELGALTGEPVKPVFQPGRAGEVRHSRADITRAQTVLGYQPSITFQAGLRSMVDPSRLRAASAACLAAVA